MSNFEKEVISITSNLSNASKVRDNIFQPRFSKSLTGDKLAGNLCHFPVLLTKRRRKSNRINKGTIYLVSN